MSGLPQGHYDDAYGHQPHGTDSYYQDEHTQGYYDQHQDYGHAGQQDYAPGQGQHGNGGYYDEAYAITGINDITKADVYKGLLQR